MDHKQHIDELLGTIGKDRKWLAEQTGYSYFSVRDCLAPDGKKLSARMQAAFIAAIEKERAAQTPMEPTPPMLPDRITIEVHPTTMNLWASAAQAQNQTTKDWAITELNRAATAWKTMRTSHELRVAETPPQSHEGNG